MFRVFGDKTDQIIDRDSETIVVIALGLQGFGPKVINKPRGLLLSALSSSPCMLPLQCGCS